MKFFLLLICATVVMGSATVPQCSWACDNPVCDTLCFPKCRPSNCSVTCDLGDPSECSEPSCSTACDPLGSQDAVNDCPMCEVTCNAPTCPSGTHENCTVLCAPLDCFWDCIAPIDCAYPKCELQCASPACLTSGAERMVLGLINHAALIVLLTFVMFAPASQ